MLIKFTDEEGNVFVRNTALIDYLIERSPMRTEIHFHYGYREVEEIVVVPCNFDTTYRRINGTEWQDVSRTWMTVDHVYETRWDCSIVPEGVRRAA